ncbi:discoidin domain-containing protein [Asaia krungthepensis]|uniref:F5/8 type C domain-containing protein n=1 Tax=Asaia krungthepensis NRIC 0535 TaxID=1307925 RepID=A0ABQ0PXJ7_9PROT|nr:discoidin domain-containing protein [Asaia krungthepensis]GBQ84103.1 hypothetical protein AA0535_0416 [Asaia krungthepensis NRIC 0535]
MIDIIDASGIGSSSQRRPRLEGGFCSAPEWFPWWQIELSSVARINGFTIEGLHTEQGQPPLLTALISDNGKDWLPVWTQPLHEPEDPERFTVGFARIRTARYFRLRADSFGILAFDRLVFDLLEPVGGEQSAADAIELAHIQAEDSRVVFSTLFNESDAYLAHYVDNFLAFTPENVCLALNFPAGRVIPSELARRDPRVHIFNGQVKREKWGHTLLMGHIESYETARAIFPDFRYFATMASNALLVRPFDPASAIEQLPLASRVPVACERAYELDQEVDPVDPTYHGTWMWHHLRNSEGTGAYLKDRMGLTTVSVTQIEGLFARREDWELIQERRSLIMGLEKYISFENFMALEELLPTSIFNRFGSGQYTHISRVLWSGTRLATVDDLLEMAPKLPAHLCSMKWFDRSPGAQSTAAVTTDWGRALLCKAQAKTMNLARFQETTLATRLVEEMRKAECFGPLTDRWWRHSVQGQTGFRWSVRDIPCQRQRVDIDIPELAPSRMAPAYLFLESTGQLVSVALSMQENDEGETTLRLTASATAEDGGAVSGVHLQGYLYLSGMQGSTVFRMTVPKDGCIPHDILSRTVFYDEYGYTVGFADRLDRIEGAEQHYFVRHAHDAGGDVWIGLPVFCNATAEVTLSIGPDFKSSREELI